uniref:Uncharacterized protein n=1 Tax=Anguilla anguilla TaxID=7936 RepID=A0A0E9WZK2_ANGAN
MYNKQEKKKHKGKLGAKNKKQEKPYITLYETLPYTNTTKKNLMDDTRFCILPAITNIALNTYTD